MLKKTFSALISIVAVFAFAAAADAQSRLMHKHVLSSHQAHQAATWYARKLGEAASNVGVFASSGVHSCDRDGRLRFSCLIYDDFQQPDDTYVECTDDLVISTTDKRFGVMSIRLDASAVDCQNVGGLVLK